MCPLCGIKHTSAREIWPRPLTQAVTDITTLVTSAHDESTKWQSTKQADKPTEVSESLLDILRVLADRLKDIEEQRVKWWTSPEKRELRRRLEEEGDHKKLSKLHIINNTTTVMIEDMNARLGQFVRWTLGPSGDGESWEGRGVRFVG